MDFLANGYRFGPGSHLAAMSHRGIGIDTARREETEQRLRAEMRRLLTQLDAMPELSGVFRRDKENNLSYTPTGKPRIAQKRLGEGPGSTR